MRPATTLLAGLLAQSVAASPSPCFKEKVLDPTDRCHSPRRLDLQNCLSTVLENITQENLQTCFELAGCDSLDAKFEARWVVESCFGETELRRRQDNTDNTDTTTTEKATKTKKATTEKTSTTEETTTEQTTADTTDNNVATAIAITTVQPTSTSTGSTAASSTQTTSGTALSAESGSTSSPSECYTTITYTTQGWDIINTDSAGRVSRTYNSQKVAAKTKCADGLVCLTNGCMVADNTLKGSGIAVAIFFASAAAVAFFTLIFLCCRDRRNDKRLRAKMEAAKIAKESAKPVVVAGAGHRAVSAGRRSPAGNDRQPLMNQGMYPPSPGGSQSGRPSHDPFGDQRRI